MIDLGIPSLLRFHGPDAVRFLNGQVTQDVRKLAGGEIALPSCITDAKGKLQFRVFLTHEKENALLIIGEPEVAESLEARLTRYLIADDVETEDLTGSYRLLHFPEAAPAAPDSVLVRASNRYHQSGTDWLIPVGLDVNLPAMGVAEVEAFRISQGAPAWGRELTEGILPPEAGLEETDISYHKGCYIGQEVISRIKSAGKVNRKITRLRLPEEECGREIFTEEGTLAGELTSISPQSADGHRDALGYIKRSASSQSWWVKTTAGDLLPVTLR